MIGLLVIYCLLWLILDIDGSSLDDYKSAGYETTTVEISGVNRALKGWVVYPNKKESTSATGKKRWLWMMEFPFGWETRTGIRELLEQGFAFCHLAVGNTFGSPDALAELKLFHDKLVEQYNFVDKAVMIGLSRGGLYAFRYAQQHPSHVALIYGDAPVLNFLSWPGKGYPKDWAQLKTSYGFESDEAAQTFAWQPIADKSVQIYKQYDIPVILVVGDKDEVVPVPENTDIFVKKYREIGGTVVVIHKQHDQHNPHGLDDSSPVVDFVVSHTHINNSNDTSEGKRPAVEAKRLMLVPSVYKEWSIGEGDSPQWYRDKNFIADHGDYDIFLYQKLDPSKERYMECNRGAENAVYYEYIVSHYENLPEMMIFTHGRPFEHSKNLFDYVKCIAPNATYHSLNLEMYKCVSVWNGVWARYAIWLEQCFRDVLRILWKADSLEDLDKRIPPSNPFRMCNHMSQQFFVSREMIRKRSLEEWKVLRDVLSKQDTCHKGNPDYEHLYAFNASQRMELGPEDPELGMEKNTHRRKYGSFAGRLTQALASEHLSHLIFGHHQELEMPLPTMSSVCAQFLPEDQCPGSPCVDLKKYAAEGKTLPKWYGHVMR